MFSIRIALSIVLLWLTAAPFIADAEGQENTPGTRIIWQKELDGEIRHRRYRGDSKALTHSEPDVGISPDSTRANPVSMVATVKSVYLFDGEGHIERRIPLRWDTIPDEVKALTALTVPDYIKRVGNKREFIRELPTTDPKGRFYIIRTERTRGYDGWGTGSIRAFNVDGSLRFELRNRFDEDIPINFNGEFYIAPNGDYMVIFYHGKWEHPGAFLDMYDTTMGTRIKHVSDDDFTHYDFDPWSLSFSDDGRHVILKGNSIDYMTEAKKTRTLLIFDGHGDLIQHPEGIRARSTMSSQAQHSRKQEIYRQLVDSLTPSRERPEKVHDIKMLKDRNKGVYRSGNTLYLFEANTSP